MSDYTKIPDSIKDGIGKLQIDENGRRYKMINGNKIYQLEEGKEKLNDIIDAVRASGRSARDILHNGW